MSKKIILAAALLISLSALAYKGYEYISQGEPKEPEIAQAARTDLFAIEELISVLKPFHKARSIDATFTTMLLGIDGKTDLGSFEGRYIKDSANLYMKSIESESVLNKDFFVAVDHSQQMIFVERPELDTYNLGNFFRFGFLSDLDSLIHLPDSVVFYQKLDNNTAKLTLQWRSSQYYKTELIYEIESKTLIRVHLYPYQDIFLETEEGEISDKTSSEGTSAHHQEEIPEYVAIIYHGIKLNEPVDKKWFNTSRYFRIESNNLILTKSYHDYEIDFE